MSQNDTLKHHRKSTWNLRDHEPNKSFEFPRFWVLTTCAYHIVGRNLQADQQWTRSYIQEAWKHLFIEVFSRINTQRNKKEQSRDIHPEFLRNAGTFSNCAWSGAGGVFPVRPWRRRLHISAEVEAVGCHVEARVPGGGVLRGLPGMIHGFDDGGDGRMSFPEFKRMMQNAA